VEMAALPRSPIRW